MEIEFKASANLEDGKHNGLIDHIEYRDDPFSYTDIYIKEIETGFILKYGCPTNTTDKTKLGKLLLKFSNNIKVGEKVNPEKILNGKEITFMTITEKAKDGNEYCRIVDGSIKPLVTTEKVKNEV